MLYYVRCFENRCRCTRENRPTCCHLIRSRCLKQEQMITHTFTGFLLALFIFGTHCLPEKGEYTRENSSSLNLRFFSNIFTSDNVCFFFVEEEHCYILSVELWYIISFCSRRILTVFLRLVALREILPKQKNIHFRKCVVLS